MTGKIPFVYLTSSPFSGSTLFSFLVNAHSQVATVGEMTGPVPSAHPEDFKCSCGELIRECAFWGEIGRAMTARGFAFNPLAFDTRFRLGNVRLVQRLLSGPLPIGNMEERRDAIIRCLPRLRRRLSYLTDRNVALAASILQVTGRSVFFDASKDPMAIRYLSRAGNLDFKVVHLVRDVRGVSLSKRKNQGATNWRRTVMSWVRHNRNIERQLERLDADRWIRIRYEDLSGDPQGTLALFWEFCGLTHLVLPKDFYAVRHHIVGNRMRLATAGEVRLDEGWRRTLTQRELLEAASIAGEMHARYSYSAMTEGDLIREPRLG